MDVRLDQVAKHYGNVTVLHELNLTIPHGALQFLLGPSGCGKTTTLRLLAGLEKPSSGRIWFGERDVTQLEAADRGIGMVFQNYALWPHMTVRQNVEYGLKIKGLTKGEVERRRAEALALTQLTSYATRLPGQLSGGQQQRVALARALALRPSVLLLDEPLSNLDAQLRLEMRDNIARIHGQTGLTTIYVTHDQKEALAMGTHISVMRGGHLIQTGAPRQLYHRPATAFVAGFIGETNLVAGRYLGYRGDRQVVETEAGTLCSTIPVPSSIRAGDEVLLSIRPESVRLAAALPSGDDINELSLRLGRSIYLGELEQLQLELPAGGAFRVNVFDPAEDGLASGEPVALRIAAKDILILARDEAEVSRVAAAGKGP